MNVSALFLLVSVVVAPEAGTIFGTVIYDIDSSVMAGAVVTLWETNSSDTAVADSCGAFSLRIAPGRHTVKVSYRDYVAGTRVVSVDPGKSMRVDFRIHPKPFEMSAVKVEDTRRYIENHYEPLYYVPEPTKRFSTARAVRLALEMDAQQREKELMRLSAPRLRVTSDGGYIVPRLFLRHGEDAHYLDPQDIADFGWDHTLSRVPSIVVR